MQEDGLLVECRKPASLKSRYLVKRFTYRGCFSCLYIREMTELPGAHQTIPVTRVFITDIAQLVGTARSGMLSASYYSYLLGQRVHLSTIPQAFLLVVGGGYYLRKRLGICNSGPSSYSYCLYCLYCPVAVCTAGDPSDR